jgi:hypothetical protein
MKVKYDKIRGYLRESDEGSGGGGGAVDSVFGRTGVVAAAVSDYDASQIDNDSLIPGATVADALNNLDLGIPAWAQYSDTVYTTSNRLTVVGGAASVTLPNNSGSVINTYMPAGIKFYDEVSQKITPQTVGETYLWRLNFQCESSTNQNFVVIKIDIGGAQGVILEREINLARGANIEHGISVTSSFYALGTFLANGGGITIESEDNVDVWDISYVFTRVTVGDLDLPDAPSDGNQYARKDGAWDQVTGGGGGSTDLVVEFAKEGAVSGNSIILPYDGGFSQSMGFVMPAAGTLKDISFVMGSSSSVAASDFTVNISKLSVGTGLTGTASPFTVGSGTIVDSATLNSGGTLTTRYYRNASSTGGVGTVAAGDVLFCTLNNFAFWTINNLVIKVRIEI